MLFIILKENNLKIENTWQEYSMNHPNDNLDRKKDQYNHKVEVPCLRALLEIVLVDIAE